MSNSNSPAQYADSRFPAEQRYQCAITAEHYDEQRLRTWRGRLLHRLEVSAYTKATKELPKDYTVLDLPCGTGRLIRPLMEHFRSVRGVDISAEMLAVARKRYRHIGHVEFAQADGRSLPFADKEFGCVFSCRLFGHTPPEVRVAILREMRRVTQDRVALVMYVRSPIISIRKKLQWTFRPPKHPWYPIASFSQLKRTFSGVGLEILSVRSLLSGIMESRLVTARKM